MGVISQKKEETKKENPKRRNPTLRQVWVTPPKVGIGSPPGLPQL
jgi:hypothetical protein